MRSKSLLFSPILSAAFAATMVWAFVSNVVQHSYGWMVLPAILFAINAWGAYQGFKTYLSSKS